MELERAEARRQGRLLVTLVEHRLPDRQRSSAISRIAITVSAAVAERLARQLDQSFLAVLPEKWQIVREGITVPEISLLQEQLQTIRTLGAGAPATRAFLCPV